MTAPSVSGSGKQSGNCSRPNMKRQNGPFPRPQAKRSCAGGGSNTVPARPVRSIRGHCGPSTGTRNSRSGMNGSGVRPMRGMYSTAARPPVTPFASARALSGSRLNWQGRIKCRTSSSCTGSRPRTAGSAFFMSFPSGRGGALVEHTEFSAEPAEFARPQAEKPRLDSGALRARLHLPARGAGAIYRWVLKGRKAAGACRSGPGQG